MPASRSSTATLLLDIVGGRLGGANGLKRVNGVRTKNVEMIDRGCLFLGGRCTVEVDEHR